MKFHTLHEARALSLDPSSSIPADWVKDGKLAQKATLLHASDDERFTVKIWENSEALVLDIPAYPAHEFVTVLEGTVTLTDRDRKSATFSAGDSFTLPKGFSGIWSQRGKVRKYAVAYR